MKPTFFKSCLGLSIVLAGASLLTPYPERLARTCHRLFFSPATSKVEKKKAQPKAQPSPAVQEQPQPEPPPEPEPKPEPPTPDISSRSWNPMEDLHGLPDIQLPPFPPVMPWRLETGSYETVNEIKEGFNLLSNIQFTKGSTAAQDRKKRDSYVLDIKMKLALPEAAQGEELLIANPKLLYTLKNFTGLMKKAKVSQWYQSLYTHKKNRVRKEAASLSRLLTKHNFYDTDTILEIEAPETKRKIVWIQADMDVVSDGSDGDRLPEMPEHIRNSDFYQPTTSYKWRKLGNTPNPLLPHWEGRLKKLQKENGSASSIDHAKRVIVDLKRYSFLLADYDPFIVIPLTLKEGNSAYEPAPGDYVVVIVENKAYPAIVGDYGPRFKSGEASLRLCQEINPKARVYARAVSSLGVSYIIFPNTKKETAGPIDYDELYNECSRLLDEIGGLEEGIKLERLKNKLPD